MNLAKLVSLSIALLLIQACSHPIEIEGQGDITSASGSRNCSMEQYFAADPVCSKNYVIGAYQETYYPVPRAGYSFDHWGNDYCPDATPPTYECSFDIPAAAVQKFWGKTMPPLKAVFKYDGTSITDHIFVNGNEWAQTYVLGSPTWDELNAVCPPPAHTCTGELLGYNLDGWTWASVDDVNALFNGYIGSAELGLGPDDFATPGSYALWDKFKFGGWNHFQYNPYEYTYFGGWTSTPDATGAYGYVGTVALMGAVCELPIGISYENCTGTATELVTNHMGLKSDSFVNAPSFLYPLHTGVWLYRKAVGTPVTSNIVTANDKEWLQPALFRNLTRNQINAVCPSPSGKCIDGGVLNGHDMTGWTWASAQEWTDLINSYITYPFYYLGDATSLSIFHPVEDTLPSYFYPQWETYFSGTDFVAGLTRDDLVRCSEDNFYVFCGALHTNIYPGAAYPATPIMLGTQASFVPPTYKYDWLGAWFFRCPPGVSCPVDNDCPFMRPKRDKSLGCPAGNPITGADVITVNGRKWAQVDLFENLSYLDIQAACPGGRCGPDAVLNGYAMDGYRLATEQDVVDLFNTYLPPEVGQLEAGGIAFLGSYGRTQADDFVDAGWRLTTPPIGPAAGGVSGGTVWSSSYDAYYPYHRQLTRQMAVILDIEWETEGIAVLCGGYAPGGNPSPAPERRDVMLACYKQDVTLGEDWRGWWMYKPE